MLLNIKKSELFSMQNFFLRPETENENINNKLFKAIPRTWDELKYIKQAAVGWSASIRLLGDLHGNYSIQ